MNPDYLPHIICLGNDQFLKWGIVIFSIIIAAVYFVIAYFVCKMMNWSSQKNGPWRSIGWSVLIVFLTCAANYIMGFVVIWGPYYEFQLFLLGVSVAANVAGVFSIYKSWKKLQFLQQSIHKIVYYAQV